MCPQGNGVDDVKKKVIYPGTFDPPTLGHLDLIERAADMFDEVIIGVTTNQKKGCLFTIEERTKLIRKAMGRKKGVRIKAFDGLLVDFAKRERCRVIIKGLRELSDFTHEFQQAIVNRKLYPEMETILIMTNPKFFYLNSSIVKEVASYGGNTSRFVPKEVEKALKGKLRPKSGRKGNSV
jgi:pantetheine-phosphate adenylyltransferase